MRCDKYEVLISAYADGELDAAGKADMEEHINCCEDCRRIYEETVLLQRDLADVLTHCGAVPDLVSAITARIQPKLRFRFARAWAAAAAVAAVAICTYAFLHPTHGVNPQKQSAVSPPPKAAYHQEHKLAPQPEKPRRYAAEEPTEYVPQTKLKPVMRKGTKRILQPYRERMQVAKAVDETPAVSADAAEIVVEYSDGTYATGYAATLSASPVPQVPVAGVGRQVVADTEIVTENGIPTQRICYRIVDNEHPETLNEPTQGEPNEIN